MDFRKHVRQPVLIYLLTCSGRLLGSMLYLILGRASSTAWDEPLFAFFTDIVHLVTAFVALALAVFCVFISFLFRCWWTSCSGVNVCITFTILIPNWTRHSTHNFQKKSSKKTRTNLKESTKPNEAFFPQTAINKFVLLITIFLHFS